jgi:hypothetical protein
MLVLDPSSEVRNYMSHFSCSRLVAALILSSSVYFIWDCTLAATRTSASAEVELDHLIPREKWTGTGLNKLTVTEQQTLAEEITALLGATRSTESAAAGKDRSQWRMLKRHMSKDDVRKLLGEPVRVSVSRFYESWDFFGGTVIFDGKDRVDSWTEM